jgi:hypothetical protein
VIEPVRPQVINLLTQLGALEAGTQGAHTRWWGGLRALRMTLSVIGIK